MVFISFVIAPLFFQFLKNQFLSALVDEVSTRRKIPVCKSKDIADMEQTSEGTPSVVRECVNCKKRFAIFPFG
jgi:hypothetical protein